jgi:hypothetical protein
MHCPTEWNMAVSFAQADSVQNGRYWFKRSNLPECPLDTSEDTLARLRTDVSEFFKNKEYRGHQAAIEHHTRPDGGEYYFVYMSDFADAYHAFDDSGALRRFVERHTFEVIFVFHQQDNVLELYTKGGKEVVLALQQIFTRIMLHDDLPPLADCAEYSLNMLLNPDFAFPTDPEDGITKVAVRLLES